jgi:phage replication-related protein YjqB (UPF0714/DUF867 family)
MADKYPNFEALSSNEISGTDYRVLARRAQTAFAIVAPHGGGIEPGTSEIALAIAGGEFSFYSFEGLKPAGNGDLHITSTAFNEPLCLKLIGSCATIVTIHGEESENDGEGVFVGGRDEALGGLLGTALLAKGFEVRKHPDPALQGIERKNLCNRGTTKKGVQFELSLSVRKTMFSSLTRDGRKCTTAQFHSFVETVRGVLTEASSGVPNSVRSRSSGM